MAAPVYMLGTGWCFPPRFDQRAHFVMAAGEEDVRQSLCILMGTTPGERLMQPGYGCDLRHLLFEIMDQNMVTDIKDTITRAIRLFEPRITLDTVGVDIGDWFDGLLRVALDYTVITTNTRHNLVYPLYLLEGTNTGQLA